MLLLFFFLPIALFTQDIRFLGNDQAIEQAVTNYYDSDYQDGLAALDSLLAVNQKRNFRPIQLAKLHCFRAECAFELGDATTARAAFESADVALRERSPDNPLPGFAYRIPQGLAATASDLNEYFAHSERMIALVEQMEADDFESAHGRSAVQYYYGNEAKYAGDLAEAIDRFAKAASLLEYTKVDVDLASAYGAMALMYYWVEDFPKAAFYNEQALAASPTSRPEEYFRILTNLVGNYVDLRQIENAREKLVDARRHARVHRLADSERWPYYYAAKIEMHNTVLELDSMKTTIDEQLAFYERYPAYEQEISYGKFLNQYAGWHIRRKEYQQAAPLIEQSIELLTGRESPHENAARFLRTKVLCSEKKFTEAIEELQWLICEADLNGPDSCRMGNPHHIFRTDELRGDFTTIEYIKDKASYYKYWYDHSPSDTLLWLSNANVALADSLLANTKKAGIYPGLERTVDELSLELRKIQMANIFAAADGPEDAGQVEAALNASERIKQLSISERLHEQLLEDDFGLPETAIERERFFIQEIKELLTEVRITSDTARRKELRAELRELSEKQQRHRDMIKANYPAYFDLLYTPPPLTIDEVRERIIAPGEAMLHFVARNDYVYVIAISQKNVRMEQLKLSQPLDDTVTELLDGLRKKENTVFPTLRRLYLELISPIEEVIGDHDLVIVPDGHLWYLPFAALLTEDEAPLVLNAERSYLLKERNIRYLLSTRLAYFQSKQAEIQAAKVCGILGMSPLANQNIGTFDSLPRSLATLELLERLSNTRFDRYFKNERATKNSFNRFAPSAAVLHIGTHAWIDDRRPEDSFLLFHGEAETDQQRLTAAEIYNLELPAHLAVLSACSTAQGSLRRGQGVANLARAFAHAGCRNLVVNLWEIKDLASSQLMKNFYPAILTDEQPTAAAFNAAQLNFIENAEMNAHPGYWATGIYIGNNEKIELNNRTSPWVFLLSGIAGCFLAAFGLYRSINNTTA
ncbi:hypothetical protein CEQ90_15225 [Lewinellaceae bacterium SD302]|nr:hypothetical protein CEQ90_15225 [Lewinellaceae bacterium SD302]